MGLKINQANVMTSGALFPKAKIMPWKNDWKKITFGIELEFFIIKKNSHDSLIPATEKDFQLVLDLFEKHFHYKGRRDFGGPYRFSIDDEFGYVSIRPDFSFHILEISFSPVNSAQALAKQFQFWITTLDNILSQAGLKRFQKSYWEGLLVRDNIVALDRLKGHVEMLDKRRQKNASPLCDSFFPGRIVSTHVHLNLSQDDLALLPALYELEWFVPRFFNQHTPVSKDVRTLLYEINLGADYLLKTIPASPPTNIEGLIELYHQSPGLFPNDPNGAVRDLSYIRPRAIGTFEFRSADSLGTLEELLDLVGFRMLQLLYAKTYQNHLIDPSMKVPRQWLLSYAQGQEDLVREKQLQIRSRLKELLNHDFMQPWKMCRWQKMWSAFEEK